MAEGTLNSGCIVVPRRARRGVLVPLIIACALFMENLDGTVTATALPAIAESMGVPTLHLSLAITSYMLSLSVFIPISGWIADRFGARRIFRLAILIFTASSAACAISQSLGELISARLVQGIGGAMMVPVGRLVLLRETPKSELVSAMSYMTIPALLGPLLGPPLGGFIVSYASWRWIFVINLPIGLLGYWLVTRFIDDVRPQSVGVLDLAGWLMIGAGLTGLVFGFENIGRDLLPGSLDGAMIGAGLLLTAAYAGYAWRRSNAVVNLQLLRIPTFSAAISGGSLYRIATGSITLMMPLMFQLGFGYSALRSGLTTFALAIGSVLMKAAAPRIIRRWGFRPVLIANTLLCSMFLLLYAAFRPDWPSTLIIMVLLAGGFFSSLQFTCFNTMVFADIDEAQMSQATSFSSTAQQLALSLGVGLSAQLLVLILHYSHRPHPGLQDFSAGFNCFALVAATAVLIFRKLPIDAGSSVSGNGGSH